MTLTGFTLRSSSVNVPRVSSISRMIQQQNRRKLSVRLDPIAGPSVPFIAKVAYGTVAIRSAIAATKRKHLDRAFRIDLVRGVREGVVVPSCMPVKNDSAGIPLSMKGDVIAFWLLRQKTQSQARHSDWLPRSNAQRSGELYASRT